MTSRKKAVIAAEIAAVQEWERTHKDLFNFATLATAATAADDENVYLANRLHQALSDGIAIGRQLQLADDKAKLQSILND